MKPCSGIFLLPLHHALYLVLALVLDLKIISKILTLTLWVHQTAQVADTMLKRTCPTQPIYH
jgi:hypothetical protein